MKLITLLSVLAIVIFATQITGQTPAQDPSHARAVTLWEEVLRAKGGRNRLHAVQNVLIISRVNVEKPNRLDAIQTRRLYALPDRAWLRASTPGIEGGGFEAVISSIEQRRCTVKLVPEVKLPGLSPCALPDWSDYLIQDPVMYLLETKWSQARVLSTRVEGSSAKKVDVVEVQVARLRVDYYLDNTTRLPFKAVVRKSEGTAQLQAHPETTITFDNYTNVEGIQMPHKVTRESAARSSLPSRQIENAEYSFNVEAGP